jgi:hypothetical protein
MIALCESLHGGVVPVTKALDDVLAANQSYVEGFGDKGSLALPPARRFAILNLYGCAAGSSQVC